MSSRFFSRIYCSCSTPTPLFPTLFHNTCLVFYHSTQEVFKQKRHSQSLRPSSIMDGVQGPPQGDPQPSTSKGIIPSGGPHLSMPKACLPPGVQRAHPAQYFLPSNKGPYTVFIREVKADILPVSFAMYINKTYPSAQKCKRNHNKMQIILSDLAEANALVVDPKFGDYHVYIPAAQVEVDGAANYKELSDLNDLNDLTHHAMGHFNNPVLPAVAIKKVNDAIEVTNTVKITFDGCILPDYLVIAGLRVRVRAFYSKPMFCKNCCEFNHTEKFCRRKPRCARCGEQHTTSKCDNNNVDRISCPYCQTSHDDTERSCPFFVQVQESYKRSQADKQRAKYSKAVMEHAAISAPADHAANFPALSNPFDELDREETSEPAAAAGVKANPHCNRAVDNPWAKKRAANSSRSNTNTTRTTTNKRRYEESYASVVASKPQPKKTTTAPKPPAPGLQNSRKAQSSSNDISNAILEKIREQGTSEVWITILQAILPAIINAIVPNLSTLLGSMLPALMAGQR